MISVMPTYHTLFRAFGWVQDPSNLRSLCDVVAVFDANSEKHRELVSRTIPRLVAERDGRDSLIAALEARPVKIPYSQLVGTAFTPRSHSRCNGIVQAAVKGQKREFIGDWPADNYVRWAHCFGFLQYDYAGDTFEITEQGRKLTGFREKGGGLSAGEKEVLTNAALAYPPAIRILGLLAESQETPLTKFELGQRLGFLGEDGFTNMPQKILVRALAGAEPKDRNAMKADWEGSSDKYSRMIASWLEKLGLVEKVPKKVTVTVAGRAYSETLNQAYLITAAGMTALGRARGKSRHKRIPKNVCWEMLATKGAGREYLRTRRAFLLKCISESKRALSLPELQAYLKRAGLEERESTIRDDMKGLRNIGLEISEFQGKYLFQDEIAGFVIPLPQSLARPGLEETKEALRAKLTHLSHEYLSLLDLAYDSQQNRLFEMKTLELFTEELQYHGLHLGGSRRPDGIIFTQTAEGGGYGVIIDTKAYSKGYSLPISQADEMERYIGENQTRDEKINPNKWWENFGCGIGEFYFLFVSGHFTGSFQAQLERISRNKGISGGALPVTQLLLCAEAYKAGALTHEEIRRALFQNREVALC